MAEDYVPKVSRKDVRRIVRREFPPAKAEKVLAILDQYGSESSHRERNRVQLAILKLSGGDIQKLRDEVKIANSDYRDVLAPAEYPEFFAIGFVGIDRLSRKEVNQLQKRDWEQYQQWLKAK